MARLAKLCGQCGAEVGDSTFCAACGTPVTGLSAAADAAFADSAPTGPPPGPSGPPPRPVPPAAGPPPGPSGPPPGAHTTPLYSSPAAPPQQPAPQPPPAMYATPPPAPVYPQPQPSPPVYPQPVYPQPVYAQPVVYTQPVMYHQPVMYPQPVMYTQPPRSKATAAILCFFLGGFGVHRFYTGQTALGLALLLTTLILGPLTCGYWWFATTIWVLVDFVLILTGSVKDQYNQALV